ncbi:hypothetical protein MT418_007959 [Batrachochytrium dendrobatidis]
MTGSQRQGPHRSNTNTSEHSLGRIQQHQSLNNTANNISESTFINNSQLASSLAYPNPLLGLSQFRDRPDSRQQMQSAMLDDSDVTAISTASQRNPYPMTGSAQRLRQMPQFQPMLQSGVQQHIQLSQSGSSVSMQAAHAPQLNPKLQPQILQPQLLQHIQQQQFLQQQQHQNLFQQQHQEPSQQHLKRFQKQNITPPLFVSDSSVHGLKPLHKYEYRLPSDRLLSRSGGSDYVDVYLQRHGQPEDKLDETTVKAGYTDKSPVQNETLSVFESIHIYDHLSRKNVFQDMVKFASTVLAAQSQVTFPKESQFTISRRTGTSSKTYDNWIDDLFGNIPFSELSKSVPFGLKLDKLLESLQQKQVSLVRATWAIKMIGVTDLASSSRLSRVDSHLDASFSWTSIVIAYIQKQINEVSLSAVNTPQISQVRNQKRTQSKEAIAAAAEAAASKHISPKQRHHFISRWDYLMRLCAKQYEEGLLDQGSFLKKSLEIFKMCNFSQTMFAVTLISMFVLEIGRSRALMRLLVSICLKKLKKLKLHISTSDFAKEQYNQLVILLQRGYRCAPDTFVSTKLWVNFEEFLTVVFADEHQTRMEVESRNNWLISSAPLTLCASESLNVLFRTLGYWTNYSQIYQTWNAFFDGFTDISIHLRHIFNWALADSRPSQDSRAFIAARLVSEWYKNMLNDNLTKKNHHSLLSMNFAKLFYKLLDKLIATLSSGQDEQHRLFLLFSQLEQLRVFSIRQYAQRLVSRGDLDSSSNTSEKFKCFLQGYPLRIAELVQNCQLYHKNDVNLANDSDNDFCIQSVLELIARTDTESRKQDVLHFENIKKQIIAVLPRIYISGDKVDTLRDRLVQDMPKDRALAWPNMKLKQNLISLVPIWRIRLSIWLKKCVVQFIVKAQEIGINNWKTVSTPGNSTLNDRQLATVIWILETLRDYPSLLEILMWLINKTTERNIYRSIVFALERHQLVFHAMGCSQLIFDHLFEKHQTLRKRGTGLDPHILRHLFSLLTHKLCEMDFEERKKLESDRALPLKRGTSKEIPLEFRDLRDAKDDRQSITNAASSLIWRFQDMREALARLFKYSLILLSRQSSIMQKDDFRRRVTLTVEVLREVADRNPSLQASIIDHYRDTYVTSKPFTVMTPGTELLGGIDNMASTWSISMIVQLITSRCCPLQRFLDEVVDPIISRAKANIDLLKSVYFTNLISNMVYLLSVICISTESVSLTPQLILTLQQYQYLERLRVVDMHTPAYLSRILHILQSLAFIRSRLTSTSAAVDIAPNEQLLSGIQVLLTYVLERPGWFKHACITDQSWISFDLARLFTDAKNLFSQDTLALDMVLQSTHVVFKALWDTHTFDGYTENTVEAPFNINAFETCFERICRHSNACNRDRCQYLLTLTLELLHLHQSIHASGVTAVSSFSQSVSVDSIAASRQNMAEAYSKCWDRLVDVCFKEVLGRNSTSLSHLLPKMRWEFLKRLVVRSQQLMESVHSLLSTTPLKEFNLAGTNIALDADSQQHLVVNTASIKCFGEFTSKLGVYMCHRLKEVRKAKSSGKTAAKQTEDAYLADISVLAAFILRDLLWFQENIKVFDLMVDNEISFGKAHQLSTAVSSTDLPPSQLQDQVMLAQIQEILIARLTLVKTLAPVIMENPIRFQIVLLAQSLMKLLVSKLVTSTIGTSHLFQITLDVVSWFMEEIPKDLSKGLFAWLVKNRQELSLPSPAGDRVNRILPFVDRNRLVSNLIFRSSGFNESLHELGTATSSSASSTPIWKPSQVSASVSTQSTGMSASITSPTPSASNTPHLARAPIVTSDSKHSTKPASFLKVDQHYFLPWKWLEDPGDVVLQQQPPAPSMCWANPNTIAPLNNTPISLTSFGAKVLHPMEPAYIQLHKQGWTLPDVGSRVSDNTALMELTNFSDEESVVEVVMTSSTVTAASTQPTPVAHVDMPQHTTFDAMDIDVNPNHQAGIMDVKIHSGSLKPAVTKGSRIPTKRKSTDTTTTGITKAIKKHN